MSVYIAGIDGKLKKVAGNFVPKENPNLDCLRTETVYDMSSSDANKNWGYVNGIGTGKVISGKDFSRYDKLIIHATFENTTSGTGILDLSHKLSGTGTYRTKLIFGPASTNHVYYYCFVRVDGNKTEFANGDMGYSSASETGQLSSTSTFISKIEGVLKTPAMIYTGSELHEGNGISIDNGVISSNIPFIHINKQISGLSNSSDTATVTSVDLSDVLPNDGNNYMLLLSFAAWGQGDAGKTPKANVYSSIITEGIRLSAGRNYSSEGDYLSSNGIIPISGDREFSIEFMRVNYGTLIIHGYWRC